jgi:hypothetical protein
MNTKVGGDGIASGVDAGGDTASVSNSEAVVSGAKGTDTLADGTGNEGDPGDAFMGLLDDLDDSSGDSSDSGESNEPDLTSPQVEAGSDAPKQVTPPQAVKQDPAQPQVQQQVQQQQPEEKKPPVQGQPPQGSEGQSQPQEPPKPFLAQLEENRVALKQNLAQRFKLDPATVEKLESNAEEAIPEILADHYLNVVAGMYNLLGNVLPKMIEVHTTSSSTNKATNDEFFGKFPNLQKPEYAETIQAVGMQLRRAQPNLSREQLLERIGNVVSMMVGEQAPPVQPAAVAKPKPRGKPFTPAVGSPGAVKQQPNAPVNPWEEAVVAFESDFGE